MKRRNQLLLHTVQEEVAFVAPSMTIGAVIPEVQSASTKVVAGPYVERVVAMRHSENHSFRLEVLSHAKRSTTSPRKAGNAARHRMLRLWRLANVPLDS